MRAGAADRHLAVVARSALIPGPWSSPGVTEHHRRKDEVAPMNDNPRANGSRGHDPYAALRLIALIAAIAGVLVLAAAAFVLSYGGIHKIALPAGVSASMARIFPVIFDAMLVV